MRRRDDGPRSLGDSLRDLVGRFRQVDFDAMTEVRERWADLVGDALATRCEPLVVRDGVLYVRVPTGAYAEAMRRESARIIEGLSDLGEHAPREVRTTVGEAPTRF
jgi:predicted nucleic acid-binding Zn ribbon protein